MGGSRVEMLVKLREYGWDREEWFAPLAPALEGVGPAEAAWQPPGGGNTIRQIVNHLNHYNQKMLDFMQGKPTGPTPDNDTTFGEPGDSSDAKGWQAALDRTHAIARELHQALSALDEAALDELHSSLPLWSVLARWIMHDAHHAGQILLIRKQQGSWPARR